ncbi:MAG: VTT domain-containing protein [Betaproteobacteria bacterium]|nr:VTT domain-containing protein [Betaproteobacteria bacterium]
MHSSLKAKIIIAVAAVALVALGVWQSEWDMSWLESWIGRHFVLGAGIYFVLVVASVVLLPFSSLPLLPLATRSYGVILTALLSAAGWWAGCLIAFQIARLGRRYLERSTSLEAVDRIEEKIPEDVGFGGIVVLRMILPVDVVSFALGLLKRLRFRTYAVASLVGILPFAFVMSYAGGQLGAGRFLSFALVVAGMVAVVLVVRRLWKAHR